jgi:hypothetical protein
LAFDSEEMIQMAPLRVALRRTKVHRTRVGGIRDGDTPFKVGENAVKRPSPITVVLILLAVAMNLIVLLARASVTAHAQANPISLASLQGNYVGKSTGFTTVCTNIEGCSFSSPTLLSFNFAAIAQASLDGAGNFCAAATNANAPVKGSAAGANVSSRTIAGSITSFDPATLQGEISFQIYTGGSCTGPSFNNYGATLTTNGTGHVAVSDSGQQIDGVATSYVSVDGTIGSVVNTVTYRKQ